jgi:hypothetical protein
MSVCDPDHSWSYPGAIFGFRSLARGITASSSGKQGGITPRTPRDIDGQF